MKVTRLISLKSFLGNKSECLLEFYFITKTIQKIEVTSLTHKKHITQYNNKILTHPISN